MASSGVRSLQHFCSRSSIPFARRVISNHSPDSVDLLSDQFARLVHSSDARESRDSHSSDSCENEGRVTTNLESGATEADPSLERPTEEPLGRSGVATGFGAGNSFGGTRRFGSRESRFGEIQADRGLLSRIMNLASAVGSGTERGDGYRDRTSNGEVDRGNGSASSRIEADGTISGTDISFLSSDRHSSVSSSEASNGIDACKDSSEAGMSARDGTEGVGAVAWEERFERNVDENGIQWLGAAEEGRERGSPDVSEGSRGDGGVGAGETVTGATGSSSNSNGTSRTISTSSTSSSGSGSISGNGRSGGLDALRLLLRPRVSERTREEAPQGREGLGDRGRDLGTEGTREQKKNEEEEILRGNGGFGDPDVAVEGGVSASNDADAFTRGERPWNGVAARQAITRADVEYPWCYGVQVAGLPVDVSEEDTWQMMEGRGGEVVDVRLYKGTRGSGTRAVVYFKTEEGFLNALSSSQHSSSSSSSSPSSSTSSASFSSSSSSPLPLSVPLSISPCRHTLPLLSPTTRAHVDRLTWQQQNGSSSKQTTERSVRNGERRAGSRRQQQGRVQGLGFGGSDGLLELLSSQLPVSQSHSAGSLPLRRSEDAGFGSGNAGSAVAGSGGSGSGGAGLGRLGSEGAATAAAGWGVVERSGKGSGLPDNSVSFPPLAAKSSFFTVTLTDVSPLVSVAQIRAALEEFGQVDSLRLEQSAFRSAGKTSEGGAGRPFNQSDSLPAPEPQLHAVVTFQVNSALIFRF
ncbi:unnamed protein product [Closterium sp. NIES-54]